MRDAQSLRSSSLGRRGTLTLESVHQRLGTASDERLLDLIDALAPQAGRGAVSGRGAANEGVSRPTAAA